MLDNTIQMNLFDYFMDSEEFTIAEATELVKEHRNIDVNDESIRARIYEGVDQGIFKRVSRGVYKVEKQLNESSVTCLLINGNGRDLSFIEDNSIDGIITDHPYDLSKSLTGGNRKFATYELFKYQTKDFEEKNRVLKEGAFCIEFLPEENEVNFEYLYEVKQMALKAGFKYFAKVPWIKGDFVANTGRKAKNIEDVMIFSKGEPRSLKLNAKKNYAEARENNLDIEGLSSEEVKNLLLAKGLPVHYMKGTSGMLPKAFDFQPRSRKEKVMEAEKPVELLEEIIEYITLPNETVLDQFGGSGNVAIAATNKQRNSIVIEKDQTMFDKMEKNISEKTQINFSNIEREENHMNNDTNKVIEESKKLSKFEKKFLQEFLDDSGGFSWWQKPWISTPVSNAFSKKEYQGLNKMYLSLLSKENDPRYATFKQANQNGYSVAKGSKGIPIQYFSFIDIRTKKEWDNAKFIEFKKHATSDEINKELKNRKMLKKEFYVFNAENLISRENNKSFSENNPLLPYSTKKVNDENFTSFQDTLENAIDISVKYEKNSASAFYNPAQDKIVLPFPGQFKLENDFIATYFHEMSHATGHSSRLKRDIINEFGTPGYAKEELIAEMTSVFLLAQFDHTYDISSLENDNHISYLNAWQQYIDSNEPELILDVIKNSVKIKDYILENGNYQELYIDQNINQEELDLLIQDLELVGLDSVLENEKYDLETLEEVATHSPKLQEALDMAKKEKQLDSDKLPEIPLNDIKQSKKEKLSI